MIVHWGPCRDDSGQYARVYTQPEPDVIGIGDEYEVDLSDAAIVEYDIPPQVSRWLSRAWREGGELHVGLTAFYRKHHASIWETQPFRGIDGEDYGEREALSWKDYDPRV